MENDSKREDIANTGISSISRPSIHNFRCDEAWSPTSQVNELRAVHSLSQPEVNQLSHGFSILSGADHDVLRLQVPVHDSSIV